MFEFILRTLKTKKKCFMKNKKVQQSEGQIWGGNLKVMRQQITWLFSIPGRENSKWKDPGVAKRLAKQEHSDGRLNGR